MRRLLIVTYHFPPSAASGGFRMLGFTRHLPKHGWNVGVVAPPTLPWEPTDPALSGRVPDDTAIFAAPYDLNPLTKPIRRYAPYGAWLPYGWQACRKAIRDFRPDVIMTSGPPHCIHRLGAWMTRWYKIPWAIDLRDPWATGYREAGLGTQAGRRATIAEERAVRLADMVICNTEGGTRLMAEAMPNMSDKLVTVTNGYDAEIFDGLENPRPAGGPLTLLHAGMIYAGRDPRPILEALRLLGGTGLQLEFLGLKTAYSLDLEGEVRQRGLQDRVLVAGHVPYDEALRQMAEADGLLLLDAAGRSVGVPAKLYEYLGAGRPIMALAEQDGDVAWVLRESGVMHRIAVPNDPTDIARCLIELAAEMKSKSEVERTAIAGVQRFTREGSARILAEYLNRCVAAATTA